MIVASVWHSKWEWITLLQALSLTWASLFHLEIWWCLFALFFSSIFALLWNGSAPFWKMKWTGKERKRRKEKPIQSKCFYLLKLKYFSTLCDRPVTSKPYYVKNSMWWIEQHKMKIKKKKWNWRPAVYSSEFSLVLVPPWAQNTFNEIFALPFHCT